MNAKKNNNPLPDRAMPPVNTAQQRAADVGEAIGGQGSAADFGTIGDHPPGNVAQGVGVGAQRGGSISGLSPAKPRSNSDIAIDDFAITMKSKMNRKAEEGYGGWDETSTTHEHIADCLLKELTKPNADPVDIANFAMMISYRGGAKEMRDLLHHAFEVAQAERDELGKRINTASTGDGVQQAALRLIIEKIDTYPGNELPGGIVNFFEQLRLVCNNGLAGKQAA